MKLCAIYNVWDDWDLFELSVKNISKVLDDINDIVLVTSEKSNYGEHSEVPQRWRRLVVTNRREPVHAHPVHSETDRRNYGLQVARERGYTHFITMDADEFYDPAEFQAAKDQFHVKPDLLGLVVESQVYFKSPTLTIGKDITLVPHIHKLTPTIRHEFNKNYPFAWSGKQIRIDPTRSFNINSGVEMFDCTMHHYSWVRKDFQKKIRNSTARANLERSTIVQDLLHAKEGYFCQFYQKPLVRVPNRFGIPEYGENEVRELDNQNL